MFKKTKYLTAPIAMFKVPIAKYYRNKEIFNRALKNRKMLNKLKLHDFKPIEHK